MSLSIKYAVLSLSLTLLSVPAVAQISIGGDVYGGGKQGAVGTAFAASTAEAATQVRLKDDAPTDGVTNITIYDGAVRTVFGGGENGRTYGSTAVTVSGRTAQIGRYDLKGHMPGGLYGGGDGASADVFGNTVVTIKGGQIIQKVYGGGNQAALMGHTTVRLMGGDIHSRVFGGARMANIYGHAFVHVDGEHLENDLVADAVFGGNDISGVIAPSTNANWPWTTAESSNLARPAGVTPAEYGISDDETWNAYILTTPEQQQEDEAAQKHILIGQLFGGGDGDGKRYTYEKTSEQDDTYRVTLLGGEWNPALNNGDGGWQDKVFDEVTKPEVNRTYMELRGGSVGYVYGGGNEVTVTGAVDICINNTSRVTSSIKDGDREVLTTERMDSMGLNTVYTNVSAEDYQFSRVFGGNNKAAMSIQPTWHLKQGKIDNLYSGGNAGNMTIREGLLLHIGSPDMTVNNVYGGCRMADVNPDRNSFAATTVTLNDGQQVTFPEDMPAHVLITAGNINNVYGGNDISGDTYGGNAIDIRCTIHGNVYGGGNGSYAYTDNADLKETQRYGDFYYQPGSSSIDALFAHRPHAEQVYIHLSGADAEHPTYIGGAVYCGGNSASLAIEEGDTRKRAAIQMGNHVIANYLFMGSNGENMISEDILNTYASSPDGHPFSTIDLTDPASFGKYMEAVAVANRPELLFDDDYEDDSSKIGSFFVGGNKGSMTASDVFEVDFTHDIGIFSKLVGGSNNANVDVITINDTPYTVNYQGGLTGAPGEDGVKVRLNIHGLELEPKQLVIREDGTYDFEWDLGDSMEPEYDDNGEYKRDGEGHIVMRNVKRLIGGNIYGGCYNSGYINGDVEINLMDNTASPEKIYRMEVEDEDGNVRHVENSGVTEWQQSQDIYCNTLTLYGGGYGEDSEIRGNVTVNVNENGRALQIFGGGQRGLVSGNTTINIDGGAVDEVYGGGFEGRVTGNTRVNLRSGECYDVFGGACNADVDGYTEVIIGEGVTSDDEVPVAANIYGGNDFGGTVHGTRQHAGYQGTAVTSNTYVEYHHGRIDSICGGCYGNYEYTEIYKLADQSLPRTDSAFVAIRTAQNLSVDSVGFFLGGSEGCSGEASNDRMQTKSYVLVDGPGLNMPHTSVFGAGAHAGLGIREEDQDAVYAADEQRGRSDVWLVRGRIQNAYGSSLNEGYTFRSNVHVPTDSRIRVNAIFGGGLGDADAIPCDARLATINYHGASAQVDDAIYGGNYAHRRTLESHVNITAPVQTSNATLADVYGAGYGAPTWTDYTFVNLENGAQVENAFGGGREGKVLDNERETRFIAEAEDRYTSAREPIEGQQNTEVAIHEGALVTGSVYGGGLGDEANVLGTTSVKLLGGTVQADLYGGGYGGSVSDSTVVTVLGGTARQVFGGGLNGYVGQSEDVTTDQNYNASTNIIIGSREGTSHTNGVPAIQRSVYGGGYNGAVYGEARVQLNQGFVGYNYQTATGSYTECLGVNDYDTKELLSANGNLFGGGYGEGAVVERTNVSMFDGRIRNGLYGGGEIAAVGWGSVDRVENDDQVSYDFRSIERPGHTHVHIYGGQVDGDVFGGGRGFSYDIDGMLQTSTTQYTSGYVFGTTDVNIYRGTIGTDATLATGHGNVFGGGNIGYVYSAYYGSKNADGHYVYNNDVPADQAHDGLAHQAGDLTEDCRVSIEVAGVAKADVTIGDRTFEKGTYIPNAYLNLLTNNSAQWDDIEQTGVTVRNAVFAGGNVSSGSDQVYAFSRTIFGNATAAVVDVFSRDLVSVGGDGVGGLYGDGNLTFVDGYREVNISNYGTDFYALPSTMDLNEADDREKFNELTERQRAIYVTKYEFDGDPTGDPTDGLYEKGDIILNDEYNKLTEEQKTHWSATYSVINEGRYINTIQRADFCGIFGSRLVLRGAMDRAQDKSQSDYTNYTINRVSELSLNQQHTAAGQENDVTHGCYFGIYNVVNRLGGITSDVRFDDIRQTASTNETDSVSVNGKPLGQHTYYEWKQAKRGENNINNGSSLNKIALASGVFLEIVDSLNADGSKEYGPITGIVELDLLNVTPGEGGGYVYAKNLHGERTYDATKEKHVVLAHANTGARTNRAYTYKSPSQLDTGDDMQTSGNFVSSLKRIVDDCFPTSKSWRSSGGAVASPAHYWYIRGEFYVYEQEVSAYTGSADAYTAQINIPLTIMAQSNARLRLLNVLPGLYADPSTFPGSYDEKNHTWVSTDSLEILFDNSSKRFGQNDPISFWDWYQTTKTNQLRFVTQTYVCREQVTVDGKTYYPGQGILPDEYEMLKDKQGTDYAGETVNDAQQMFNVTNGISRDNGYVLTLGMTNPQAWTAENASFRCKESGCYGQYFFEESAVTSQTVINMQDRVLAHLDDSKTQAVFEPCFVALDSCEVIIGGVRTTVQRNSSLRDSVYQRLSATDRARFDSAYICVNTVRVNDSEYYILNQLVPRSKYQALRTLYGASFQPAYYCTRRGSWGGNYYEKDHDYSGRDYCQLLAEERQYFSYNYNALDLLVTNFAQSDSDTPPTREELMRAGSDRNLYVSKFDGPNEPRLYSTSIPIDYTATYTDTDAGNNFTFVDSEGQSVNVSQGTRLSNVEYMRLPNAAAHYAWISVNSNHMVTDASDEDHGKYRLYIVKNTFDVGGEMYNAGRTISKTSYDALNETLKDKVEKVVMNSLPNEAQASGYFYYCIESYQVGEHDATIPGYVSPTIATRDGQQYHNGEWVPVGAMVNAIGGRNYQKGFDVSGEIPTEETSLYVPVTADFNELSKDRYVTAIFEYTYTETDASGLNFETRVEKHIVNLRIRFMSGRPVIGAIKEPDVVLPLEKVALDVPYLQEGAFPILTGGWEIYENEADALKHRNGREYNRQGEQLYFYQDQNYMAYYAETRMGRTYSDPVPLHVANYQRMSDVITDPNHMYINHALLKRNPKIYIDGRTVTGQGYNELDALQDLFAIANSDYGRLNQPGNHGRDITGASGLDFFVQADMSPTKEWKPVGDGNQCFAGNFHGNGHHLSNLSASLFGNLCGHVYNVGVTGSFSLGGIADSGSGRIENCWVSTSGAPAGKAVFADLPLADGTTNNPIVVNSYYPKEQGFTDQTQSGITPRPWADFLSGAVTYDLNRNYLEARYRMFSQTEGSSEHYAFYRMPDGSLKMAGDTTPDTARIYSFRYPDSSADYGYVERLYSDGDFRYADGLKPKNVDMRLSQQNGFLPVFPDDYIFFGQRLSYGLYSDRANQTLPAGIEKDASTLLATGAVDNTHNGLLTTVQTRENRVYRALAYYGNGTLGRRIHFNANAALTDAFGDVAIHRGMTAVDFTGGNGDTHGHSGVVAGDHADFTDRQHGYGPLTDYERIDSLRTSGLTHNLLLYVPNQQEADAVTCRALANWAQDVTMPEPAAGSADKGHNSIDVVNTSAVRGHVVQHDGSRYVSPADHLLVDGHDFNAPIAYTFGDARMWYQRHPSHYALHDGSGWDILSLPFTAELVTTQDKGELTHFYRDGGEQGHEYWLRQLQGMAVKDATTLEGTFNAPLPDADATAKSLYNTFLWDYYYSQTDRQDANADEYQRYYAVSGRSYEHYPRLSAATPWLVGLPGADYYEFDLSGSFVPQGTSVSISQLPAQVLTYASQTGATVRASDAELQSCQVTVDADGQTYVLRPTYSNGTMAAGEGYVLNANGNSFDVAEEGTVTRAFRPYFVRTTSPSSGAPHGEAMPQHITFNSVSSSLGGAADQQSAAEGLSVYARRHRVVVSSSLHTAADVRVFNVGGLCIASFTIEPGQTVETPVSQAGVYIVRAADGKYLQKLAVK